MAKRHPISSRLPSILGALNLQSYQLVHVCQPLVRKSTISEALR
jgi:hypothetical protein